LQIVLKRRGFKLRCKYRKAHAALQLAEELGSDSSGAKALEEYRGFIAALKALRHPKSSFSANCLTFNR
jgi:hypothetical protein